MANEVKMTFGSATTAISTTAAVANDEVVGGQTEVDNSTTLYPMATAVISIADNFAAAPAGPIDLYMVRGDVDSTTDGTALGYAAKTTSDNIQDPGYLEFVGQWRPTTDEAYIDTITISLLGVKKAKYYIHNNTGTSLNYSANAITVKITPFTFGPS